MIKYIFDIILDYDAADLYHSNVYLKEHAFHANIANIIDIPLQTLSFADSFRE